MHMGIGVVIAMCNGVRVGFACLRVCLRAKIILTYLCLLAIHRALNVQISHLSKNLHAREEQVKSLHEELK